MAARPHTGLTSGTSYHYVVTAVNAGRENVEPEEVNATPPDPCFLPHGHSGFSNRPRQQSRFHLAMESA